MTMQHSARSLKTAARLAGISLLTVPFALGALGQAHAAAASPILSSLLPTQSVSGYARTPGSVAVSGNTAVVGSVGDNAAYVFVKSNGQWVEQARLTDPNLGPNDLFGSAVAISGNTVLVGDPAHAATDCNGTPNQQTGAVFEFDRSGSTWTEAPATIDCAFAGDKLGASVAISGGYAVLGAPGANNNTGSADVFQQITPGDWQLQKHLAANDGQPGDGFATAVSISGGTAVIGAPNATVAGPQNDHAPVAFAGAAYIFVKTGQSVKSGNAWAQQARLIAPIPTSGAAFGTSVSVSGSLALVGAPFDKNGIGNGKAYLFPYSASTGWGAAATLQARDATGQDQFGGAVALSIVPGYGGAALIGAYGAQAAYVFVPSGINDVWAQSAKLAQAGALGLGSVVALSGTSAVVAAIYGNNYAGSAYAATISPALISTIVNDTDPNIVYSGSGWAYYPGRPASFNDIDNDVHATLNNGDSASYTFTGSGVEYISEISAGYGQVAVYLDGVLKATVNANNNAASNMGGQVLFRASGLSFTHHTIKIVKLNGVYMLLDAFVTLQ